MTKQANILMWMDGVTVIKRQWLHQSYFMLWKNLMNIWSKKIHLLGNSQTVLQKFTNRFSIWPSSSTIGRCPGELKTYVHIKTCSQLFTVSLFIIANRWKQFQCPWIDEWINKMWYIHIMEYYSAIKRNEVLTRAMIWMNLENIMLHERSQT